ncbi:MAG TPA: lectin [Pseudonocardiaceae bacterium]|nr:lectin [Pseudonocardiaceae bacterium]
MHRLLSRVAIGVAAALTATSLSHLSPAHADTPVADPAALVNPFIGSAGTVTGSGNTFPGADTPFGMIQWSPDTSSRPKGGGYAYGDSTLSGFSLTHISGPGCDAAGDIPFLPTTGTLPADPNTATASFSHTGETAQPGYYKVGVGSSITAELTTTTRAGIGRFTYPATAQANMIFKLAGSQSPVSATSVSVVSATELTGSVTSNGFCEATNPFTLYFAVTFDHPFTATAAYDSTSTGPGGEDVTFDTTANQTVLAKVGISHVSVAGAQANLAAEIPDWNFDSVRTAAHTAWNNLLGRIDVAGGTADQQQVFYTAMYHALLHPNVFSDADGRYLGFDGAVHTVASGHAQYANYSTWDTYRSQAQLAALVAPDQAGDMAQSMVNDYQQGGTLPKWGMNNGETYIMVGDSGTAVLADYYAFGARNFDTATALAAMRHDASTVNNVRPGGGYLDSFGYLPTNSVYGCCHYYAGVSTQLEYDTDDFALSAFAGALGERADQTRYVNRAQNWENIFNPSSDYIQPRHSNGRWMDGFIASPITGGTNSNDFAEGDSLIYTGMIPFNLAGLASAMGGNAKLVAYLNSVLSGFSGLGGLAGLTANLGNEPSVELPWEYDYAGQPYRTQSLIRQIQDQLWTNTPAGIAGNDDLGEMSAWYVWSALGMYPETPGTATLALGSPLFTQAVITLGNGKTITITAPSAADGAPYVQSMTLNGAAWSNAYLPPSVLSTGATITETLGSSANTAWASGASAAPPSYSGTPTPFPAEPTGPITSALAGFCVDDANAGTGNGTAIQLYSCNGTNAQTWTVAPDNTLQVLTDCMDVSGGATTAGTKVQLHTCNGTGAQQWTAANGEVTNPQSGLCLTDPGASTSKGTQLVIDPCDGDAGQRWTLP